jgi:cytidine deaminase
MNPIDWAQLEALADAVRKRAYAPYSHFNVGAALQVASGAIFAGCNVENASFGLTVCAERSAVAQMIAASERDPVALVVVTRGATIATPCGACRQTLAEFAADLPIRLLLAQGGGVRMTSLAVLFPDGFRSHVLTGDPTQ